MLSLALIMRLGLLTIVSWLITLTTPLFSVGPLSFSGRDLILLVGGLFLLFASRTPIRDRTAQAAQLFSGIAPFSPSGRIPGG